MFLPHLIIYYRQYILLVAVVAQLVEPSVVIRVVAGSNPVDRPIPLKVSYLKDVSASAMESTRILKIFAERSV